MAGNSVIIVITIDVVADLIVLIVVILAAVADHIVLLGALPRTCFFILPFRRKREKVF